MNKETSTIENNLTQSEIEISILACPYDTKFLNLTVPHLIRSLKGISALRTLLVDWMPVSGFYSTIYPDRQEQEFDVICSNLISNGYIDRILRIPYERKFVSSFLRKNVKGKFRTSHNIRGYPIYGSMFGVLNSYKKYLVHFDSDMLIHQGLTDNWIDLGISLLSQFDDIGAVTPRSGPPSPNGTLYQDKENFYFDSRGFNSFGSFTSRLFLVDVERFKNLHPVKPLWLGYRDKIRSLWDGKGKSLSWESIVSQAFREKSLVRADLTNLDSWSLHPPTKENSYLELLPLVIELVEDGKFPSMQAGHCDLNLKYWQDFINF